MVAADKPVVINSRLLLAEACFAECSLATWVKSLDVQECSLALPLWRSPNFGRKVGWRCGAVAISDRNVVSAVARCKFWVQTDNLSLSILLMKEVLCFPSLQSSLRGSARGGRGHASDAKRIGTRTKQDSRRLETKSVILLLKSQQG